MPKGNCSVDECERPAYSLGMCSMHYQRERAANAPPCLIDGCDRPGCAAYGWCGTHYSRWSKYGTTDDPPPRHYNVGKVPANFKGEDCGYDSLHQWVRRHAGKPTVCVECGHDGSEHRIEWANISGDYRRDLTDWRQMCVPCHRTHDKAHPGAMRRRFPEFLDHQARKRAAKRQAS